MRRFIFRALLLCVWLTTLSIVAHAHNLNLTGVKIRLDKSRTTVSVVAHLHALTTNPSTELGRRLKLRLDDQPFVPRNSQLMLDRANGIVIWQATHNKAASRVTVEAPLFPERKGESTVVTLIKDRQVVEEAILDTQHLSATLGKVIAPGAATIVARFLREGVTHIFGGPDHVLFLLSLLLLGGTMPQLIKIVTAFTLAHSITLSLAAMDVFTLPSRFVEPVIALSIVAVATTNLKARWSKNDQDTKQEQPPPSKDTRPWLAFGFGLIHGFGFAGALSEIGLPREALAYALGAFNIGVELGQAVIVLLAAPSLAQVIKIQPRLQRPIVIYGSATVALVGAFWFAERIFTI